MTGASKGTPPAPCLSNASNARRPGRRPRARDGRARARSIESIEGRRGVMSRVDGAASACAALVDAGDEDAFRRRARAVLGGTAVGEKDDAWAVRALDGGRWEGKETTVTSVGERMSEKTISRAREEAFERFQQSAEAERAAEAESESESESEDERVDETEDGDEIVKSGALVEAETGESLISIEETTTMTVSSEPASALDPFASFGNITIDPAPAVEPEVVPTTFEEDADDEFGDFV